MMIVMMIRGEACSPSRHDAVMMAMMMAFAQQLMMPMMMAFALTNSSWRGCQLAAQSDC